MYLTYTEYISLGGEMSEACFARASWAAQAAIDRVTHFRARMLETGSEAEQAVKRAFVLLADTANAEADTETGGPVASFSNDGMSVTYQQQTAAQRSEAYSRKAFELLCMYKDRKGVPLCYAGVY